MRRFPSAPTHRFVRTASIIAAGLIATAAPGWCQGDPTLPPAPAAPLIPITDTYQGPSGLVTVTDNYRWLENFDSPNTKAWSDAENIRARTYLSALPDHAVAAQETRALILSLSNDYNDMQQRPDGLFALCNDVHKQQPYLVLLPSAAKLGGGKTIFDPNVADPTGGTEIDFYQASPDGKYVGISESRGGSEDGTLHIYETATGRELSDRIVRVNYPTAGGSIAWSASDSGFFYTRYPQPGEYDGADEYNYQQVYYHKIGTRNSDDNYALGKDFPSIAEAAMETSRDGRYIVMDVDNGDGGEHAFYLHTPSGGWSKIAANEDGIVDAHFGSDDSLFLTSRHDWPNGFVERLPKGSSDLASAKVVVAKSSSAIDAVAPTENKLYVFRIVGGPSQLSACDYDGSRNQAVPLPPISAAGSPVWTTGNTLLYRSSSYIRPGRWISYTPGPSAMPHAVFQDRSPIDLSHLVAVREFAVSKDGTHVPMTIIMNRGTKLDGNNPTLIYGYGGYGISERPGDWLEIGSWCRAGGIYVDTNLRGGSEYGDAWHTAGHLLKKQNVFDDFAACAQHLIDRKYTNPSKLAARGGSNGGLLMGSQITQHPGLFKCIVSEVGDYDMLRVELQPNGPTNTTEFGTVKNPAQFAALYAYSPYHHVRDGVQYPDILFVTGDNDGRVNPMNSRKMMARLQAAAAPGSKLLLRTSANAGHGIGSSLDEQLGLYSDELAFLYDELGMTPWKPAAAK